MFLVLVRRRLLTVLNTFRFLTLSQWLRRLGFTSLGIILLGVLYHGFKRLLAYIYHIDLIGQLLIWKLTALMFLMTLSMVAVSGLLTALTTLFYSYDLKFLIKAPIPLRTVFIDKSLESVFYASWMIGLVLVPYILALLKVLKLGVYVFALFLFALPPFLLLGATFGLAFTLLLLYLFPTSRTRDVVWVISSLSMSVVYGLVRFAQPEKLIRPDMLQAVAEYIAYLQAPTVPGLPSWWITRALMLAVNSQWALSVIEVFKLWFVAASIYAGIVWISGFIYFTGYSGAQESSMKRRQHQFRSLPEAKVLGAGFLSALFWKERLQFWRDVRHWSQLLLIAGLVFVYLFSIQRLPLDSAELRSLISFLNVGTAGFVIAALGLRFVYPSVSVEGRSWWVLKSSPLTTEQILRQKFIFSAIPTLVIAIILGQMTNWILGADRFTAILSLVALCVVALAVCAMGIGFGAMFPRFNVENVHQVESSLGGFIYMAACLFYIAATIAILAWPMHMHFQARFGHPIWDWKLLLFTFVCWITLNAMAFLLPLKYGLVNLENYEE